MTSIICEAMEALQFNKLHPETLFSLISYQPNKMLVLRDEHDNSWTFITREQNRKYLLTKSNTMSTYKEIFSMAH